MYGMLLIDEAAQSKFQCVQSSEEVSLLLFTARQSVSISFWMLPFCFGDISELSDFAYDVHKVFGLVIKVDFFFIENLSWVRV